jgi:type II secretory pathway component PulF
LVVLLLTFLLPRVMGLLPADGENLPLPTKVLMISSQFLQVYWIELLVAVISIPIILKLVRMTIKGRYVTDLILHRLPLIGVIVLDIGVARFISTLRTLLVSGVEVVNSLKIAGNSTGDSVLIQRTEGIADSITKGSLLSEAFKQVKEFNSMVQSLISMSERTGQTTQALDRITDYFDTTIPRRVKRMISIMEPGVIALAGIIVGFVLVGTLLPIFNLYSSF